jgi:diguanylate cyclase (GGDEF)-like protein/PAS domain S-box-containing protein
MYQKPAWAVSVLNQGFERCRQLPVTRCRAVTRRAGHWVGYWVIVLALLVAAASIAGASPPDLSDKRVFLLYSYDPTFPTAAKVLDGIQSSFGPRGPVIDIVYMDSKRLYDDTGRTLLLAMLRHKLSQRAPYDVVIAADDNALRLLLDEGSTLFPDTPGVFLGVNNLRLARDMRDRPDITGVVEASSFSETIRLTRTLQRGRDRLHVIVDATTSGQADLETVMALRPDFPDVTFEVLSLERLAWPELAATLKSLGTRDSILLLSAYRDRYGALLSFDDSLELITANADVPVYHLWEHGLGDGVLGGVIVSHREQGRQAAEMAQRILLGESPAAIPVEFRSPNLPIFDHRQLARFGIQETALPANAEVRFRPETLWYRYRSALVGVGVTFLVLVLLASYLVRQNLLRARLADDLRDRTRSLHLLMNTLPDLVWMKDTQGRYLGCNRRFEELVGVGEADIIGRTDAELMPAWLARRFRACDEEAIGSIDPCASEDRVRFQADGHEELLETIRIPTVAADGTPSGVLGVARDISERRAAEDKIRLLSQAVDQSPVSVMITDPDGRIEYVNMAFERATGFSEAEVLGSVDSLLQASGTTDEFTTGLRETLARGESWEGEFLSHRRSGEQFWEYAHVSPVLADDGTVRRFLAVKEDITERKRQHQRILYQAHYDQLTELPNRTLSLDRMQQLIGQSSRQRTKIAVLFVDLDDFKKINDSLGHEAGDQVLVQAARRFRECLREQDTVGRLGGDEFIVIVSGLQRPEDAGLVADSLLAQFEHPFLVGDRELLLSASIGIAICPDDGEDSVEMLRKSDAAMYHAKQLGRANYAFFTAQLNARVSRRFAIEEQLHGALDRNEFSVVYQPQVELATSTVVGIEALLRWHNRVLGTVAPAEFIPVAEHSGQIVGLGKFVLDTALSQLAPCSARVDRPIRLAVNLSPRQFRDPNLFDAIMQRACSDTAWRRSGSNSRSPRACSSNPMPR